jgi:hypothetical protein
MQLFLGSVDLRFQYMGEASDGMEAMQVSKRGKLRLA